MVNTTGTIKNLLFSTFTKCDEVPSKSFFSKFIVLLQSAADHEVATKSVFLGHYSTQHYYRMSDRYCYGQKLFSDICGQVIISLPNKI